VSKIKNNNWWCQRLKIIIGDVKDTLFGGAQGTLLNGGNCELLPNPEEEDFTSNNLLDLYPGSKGTFWRKNYKINVMMLKVYVNG
jgi:hypothetical protein